LLKDSRDLVVTVRNKGSLGVVLQEAAARIYFTKMTQFFGYMIGVLVLTLLIGQKIFMPIYMAIYLIRRGQYRPKLAVGYAFGGYLVLVAFYDRAMHLLWHPSWFDSWASELLSDWLPRWLFF
jgi:hypothetical protein